MTNITFFSKFVSIPFVMKNCVNCEVRQLTVLKNLSSEELQKIAICKCSSIVKKGDLVFDENQKLSGVYVVRDGVCKLTKLSENGKDHIVKLVVKGGLLGHRSVISEDTTNLKAVALSDLEVCFIPKEELLSRLHENNLVAFDMLKDLAHNLKEADNYIVDIANKSVKKRLADLLLYIESNFGKEKDNTLSLMLSREEMANLIGTATESAIRILSQFKADGLVAFSGKKITILNAEGLEKVA